MGFKEDSVRKSGVKRGAGWQDTNTKFQVKISARQESK